MDELAKTEARNYLCAAGFFMIAAFFISQIFSEVGTAAFVEPNDNIHIALGLGLLIVATLLIVLHKRDLIAILFFMTGFWQLFAAFTPSELWGIILMGFLVLVALVTLTGQDKKKWLLFLIPLLCFIPGLIGELIGFNPYVGMVFIIILAVICLYYAFCCACERISLPGSKILTADEATDFKASGSVLGYMLFAVLTGGYALHYILGEAVLPLDSFVTMELLAGSLMIFVAILLFAVGKMRFTPIMFMLVGLIGILSMYSSGAMFIGLGILMIVLGLFAMLRKESRILPGIMLIVYGCTWFFSAYVAGTSISMPVVSALLNGIPALIAIYLSFVVYSQRKLPKF
ncbi:MAG TPA: hypothetical protein O0X27_03000 [Methanocorpusculum sp.]|nr:hypothetical protein [Methanocorpusculum sp.]